MSLFQRALRWRIARHDARAKAFVAATVAAQASGNARNAARFQEQMHHALALRDGLIAHQGPDDHHEGPRNQREAKPHCCNHNCDEGRRCPRRT